VERFDQSLTSLIDILQNHRTLHKETSIVTVPKPNYLAKPNRTKTAVSDLFIDDFETELNDQPHHHQIRFSNSKSQMHK